MPKSFISDFFLQEQKTLSSKKCVVKPSLKVYKVTLKTIKNLCKTCFLDLHYKITVEKLEKKFNVLKKNNFVFC